MSQIRITELDFDTIKQNLISFLGGQEEFSDYSFQGSGLSVLIDLLAYNTHYNAYYGNMLLSELFLDSAVKRSSAVSVAKHLGYTPMSKRGSVANISVKVLDPTGLPPQLTIDPFTSFVSTIDDSGYNFLTIKAYTASREGNEYNFDNIEVKEGQLQEFSYVVSNTTPAAKYEIPALNVDTSTISVSVQTSATDLTRETFTLSEDLTALTDESAIYFLEQNPLEKYQIYFGDDILGRSPEVGNIVIIRYLVVEGESTNVSSKITQSFQSSGSIGGSNNITCTTNSNSSDGKDKETITSIKHYAPKFNAAKNRCVTASDYEVLIQSNYSGAESIATWGGEDNDPPIYGKVFVSLKPYEGFIISEEAKETIRSDILKNKQGVTVQVEFIDPDYLYVGLDIAVEYNFATTSKTSGQIYTLIVNAVRSYFSTSLQKFDADFKHSTLINNLIDVDVSVASVLMSVTLQKRIVPVLNTTNVLTLANALKFRNAIKPGSFKSSYYYGMLNGVQTLMYIGGIPDDMPPDDLGTGTLRLINASDNSVINSDIGTINYGTGVVSINEILPVALPTGSEDIRFTCSVQERNYNLNCNRNEVFVLNETSENKITGTTEGLTVTVNGIS